MCVPGVSENKSIAVAKQYPTLNALYTMLIDSTLTEKQKKEKIADIDIKGIGGDKAKKVGKALANKIYTYFMAVDPTIII